VRDVRQPEEIDAVCHGLRRTGEIPRHESAWNASNGVKAAEKTLLKVVNRRMEVEEMVF
jgi:hypothetical protein